MAQKGEGKDKTLGAKVKNGFAPKICLRCDRPFEWRKKWARSWDEVRYCSQACKSGR